MTSTLPTVSTSSSVIIACQPSPKASEACPLDLSKPVKGVEKKRSLFGTSSSCEKSESHALDLRVQVAPMKTSTASDALEHQPKPQEPVQTDSSGVQPEGNGESDIEEDILPQRLEREVADVTPNEVEAEEEQQGNAGQPKRKRRRTEEGDDDEPVFNINMVVVNGLTESLHKVKSQMILREKASEKTGKELREALGKMGKVVSALNGLRGAVEDSAKDASRRKDRRAEAERWRDEEQRRGREKDQRREDRR